MVALARTLEPGRVVAVFQPHLYSRTRALARGFGAALAGADVALVLDIYPARERAEDFPGVSGRMVAAAAADAGGFAGGKSAGGASPARVAWIPDFGDAERYLRSILRPGDLCLVMGAGNVDALARALTS